MNKHIVVSLFLAVGIIIYGGYASRCHGEECGVKIDQKIINKKMNPVRGFSLFSSSGTRNTLSANFGTVVKATDTSNGMNPENILKQVNNKEVILLDVREDSEWQEGHIAGAVHIPLGDLNTDAISKLSKDVPIYIYCRSGNRAGQAENLLKQLGYENVINIGGINEWQENGGQLVQ